MNNHKRGCGSLWFCVVPQTGEDPDTNRESRGNLKQKGTDTVMIVAVQCFDEISVVLTG